jgi:hypothetical protein
MRIQSFRAALSALFVVTGWIVVFARNDQPAPRSTAVRYNAKGELLRPEGYRTWIFVGADLGLDYTARNDQSLVDPRAKYENTDVSRPFHNVYIDRPAYEHYARTGKFPDKTVLVLELFESKRKEPRNIVTAGQYEGNRIAVEVAVKDTERPDGSKTPWAYYDFTGKPGPSGRGMLDSAKAKPDSNCYDCHKEHADVDNVWVQFYPTLRELAKSEHR